MSTKTITGKVRFSYAHVWEPTSVEEGGDKKYSVAILIPKTDVQTLSAINAAVEAAKNEGIAKLGGSIPANLKTPLRDGDAERPDDENYVGMFFLNASSNSQPGIVDEKVQPIIDRSEFYSGCYGRASLNFYAFNKGVNKGIACGLNNLQKLADGDKLAGGSTAAEDFGAPTTDDLM